MIIMTLEGIGISFGDTVLLQNVTQGIEDYDRIGVIGINGTGKSAGDHRGRAAAGRGEDHQPERAEDLLSAAESGF